MIPDQEFKTKEFSASKDQESLESPKMEQICNGRELRVVLQRIPFLQGFSRDFVQKQPSGGLDTREADGKVAATTTSVGIHQAAFQWSNRVSGDHQRHQCLICNRSRLIFVHNPHKYPEQI